MKETLIRNIKTFQQPDVIDVKGTAGNSMIDLIQNAEHYDDVEELKEDFIIAINNTSKISTHKRRSYINKIQQKTELSSTLSYITNIFCVAGNLGMDWNNEI